MYYKNRIRLNRTRCKYINIYIGKSVVLLKNVNFEINHT